MAWALVLIPVIGAGLPIAAWSITRQPPAPHTTKKLRAGYDAEAVRANADAARANADAARANADAARANADAARANADTAEADVHETWAIRWRPLWSIPVLVVVGLFSFFCYSESDLSNFYLTAATVIATLFVAIAIGVFVTKESPGNDMTFEHWVFMIVSTAGLLAALRGLSVGKVHHAWQKELLTGLTVAGVTAAVLLVAERLVAAQVARTRAAFWWTVLFLVVAVALATFP